MSYFGHESRTLSILAKADAVQDEQEDKITVEYTHQFLKHAADSPLFPEKSKSQASLAYELITDRCHMWLVTFIFSSLNAKSCLDCQTTQAICTSFQRCFLSQILWHTHRKHSGFHLKHSAMHLPSNVSGTISDGKFYKPYWIFSIESSLQLEKRWAGWRGYQGRELFCSI